MGDAGPLSSPSPLTVLLQLAARGDRGAFDRAFGLLYDELSALARSQRRRWVGQETLGTTVLVHEAYLKLLGGTPQWHGRKHFFALAAQVMRQLLVNYAERQQASKRGGAAHSVTLDALDGAAGAAPAQPDVDWLAANAPMPDRDVEEILQLHRALQQLEAMDARRARIVECRFFAGLSIPETADALDISPATVKREWQAAREWLYSQLAHPT